MIATVTNVDGIVNYADGEVLDFTSANSAWLTGFKFGKRERGIVPVPSPGESGQGTQDFGDRSQDFTLEVIYVAATEDALVANIAADLLQLAKVSTVGIGTIAYPGCKLADSDDNQARKTGYGLCWKKMTLKFTSFRPI